MPLTESIRKTAHFDENCMKIGFLLLKLVWRYVFKMAANGGRYFEINIKLKNYQTQFISQKHTYSIHLTNVIFVIMQIIILRELFYEFCTLEKINIHCELVTSQPHWFSGSQLDVSKFWIFNIFIICCPICMKFAPNSLVLEILWIWLGFTVCDPFPLTLETENMIRRK